MGHSPTPDSTIEPAPPRPLPGGRPSIDLVNTMWSGATEPVDWFDHDRSVFEFTESYEHPTDHRDLDATRRSLREGRQLIRRIFESPSLDGSDASLIEAIERALGSSRTTLDRSDDRPVIRTTGDRTTNAVAIEAIVDAIGLVGEQPDRIRCCEHEQCTLWFLDTSKGGRRRWCSMQTCGNRTKARRHYARTSGDDTR